MTMVSVILIVVVMLSFIKLTKVMPSVVKLGIIMLETFLKRNFRVNLLTLLLDRPFQY
jgi:hypothetical protein